MTTAITGLAGASRSRTARLVDRMITRKLELPPSTGGYTVRRAVPVPMRDGVRLLADHYEPTGPVRGTVLVRSPYGRAGLFALLFARPYADRGYHVVIQSCRGTFGSQGEIGAFAGEVEDGADTVAWLRTEPWFTGSFATLGVSYLGLTQWALLTDPPPELAAAIITSGPHDTARLLRGTGALSLVSAVGWTDAVLHQDLHGPLRSGLSAVLQGPKRIKPVLDGLPLQEAAHTAYGQRAPWLDAWAAHDAVDDPFWDGSRVTSALDRTEIPVLLHTGWHDLIAEQVLESFVRLRSRGVDAALVVGPWNHAELASKGAGTITRDTLAWLAEHLSHDGARISAARVQVHMGGEDAWRQLDTWPPATRDRVLHLQPSGGLAPEPSTASEAVSFAYDPADPTPTVGGMTNARDAGRSDNMEREQRADVVIFTSVPLERDLDVMGSPAVELVHSSDNPFCDVFVRLCDVDDRGRSWNVSEQYVRLTDADQHRTLRLELSAVAHRFTAGSRVRLQVSGGSHPQYDRNLGTGAPLGQGTDLRPSRQSIGIAGSHLRLPEPA